MNKQRLKNIYISFSWCCDIEKEEIEKFIYLCDQQFLDSIWEQKIKRNITMATTLEIILLVWNLKQKWYNNIELMINPSLFIFNEDLYRIDNNKITKLDTERVGFFFVRWYNRLHPFFFILRNLVENKWWIMEKANAENKYIIDNWKFRPITCLYSKREKFIWDIIIPNWIKIEDYSTFTDFIRENIWNKIVVKRNYWEFGKEVYMVDLGNYTSKQQNKLERLYSSHKVYRKEIFIWAFKQFKNEYRVYFTNFHKKPLVFSIKIKNLKDEIDLKDIFNKDNFYYKKMFIWSDMTNDEMKNRYKYIVEMSKEFIKNLDYTTGVLEFWETLDWRPFLFEVNHMAASLCTTKEDSVNMSRYYFKIFDSFIDSDKL